ncbi:hypothetical protein ANCDUO_00755 [Ancylostoma duodenale]|uniref:CBS domain-containing protein n=1 Tax=Ancylostoma duodenale TaxID=51022 RepID=A0A0C2HB97_9BILA|nr:hypothetical protein ANCDUO_00755 [Ancylostoma duodenale]
MINLHGPHLFVRKEVPIGEAARREEAGRRVRKAIETIDMHFQTSLREIFDNNRTKSESSLSQLIPPTREAESEEEQTEGPVRRESRFTISPGKVIEPPQSTNRRHSLTRRNAFCSLEANEARFKGYMRQAKKYLHYMQFGHAKPERTPMYMYDLSQDEQKEWESARLSEEVDLTDDIDQAPFQIVKKTSLFNIHSIFSMLQLSRVYVTEGGRLIGVVALSDLCTLSFALWQEALPALKEPADGSTFTPGQASLLPRNW